LSRIFDRQSSEYSLSLPLIRVAFDPVFRFRGNPNRSGRAGQSAPESRCDQLLADSRTGVFRDGVARTGKIKAVPALPVRPYLD